MVNEPNPGMAKNDSMRRLPMKRKGIVITTVVNMGIRAFLRQCLNRTVASGRPLDLAVRI
jgi:hypothetical protein